MVYPGYNKFLVFNDTDCTLKTSHPASSLTSLVAVAIEISDVNLYGCTLAASL